MRLVRLCPQCRQERPVEEVNCSAEIDGHPCNYPLFDQPWERRTEATSVVQDGSNGDHEIEVVAPSSAAELVCPNGHQISRGDHICLSCGASIASEFDQSPATSVIAGWQLTRPLPRRSSQVERFIAQPESNGSNECVLNIFADAVSPDESIYEPLQKLSYSGIISLRQNGRFEGRYYDVWEEPSQRTLEDIIVSGPMSEQNLELAVTQLGYSLDILANLGIRHRDIRPCNVIVTSDNPSALQIGGFYSAILSQFDSEVVCPLDVTRYTAPEAILGGVYAASDWWSLGVLLLELATGGAYFEGVNEQAFLISIVTRGLDVPQSLSSRLQHLLNGLLKRNPSERWRWPEVERWIKNEIQPDTIAEQTAPSIEIGPSIELNGVIHYRPDSFALRAADPSNWDEAQRLLIQGAIPTWLMQLGVDDKVISTVKALNTDDRLSDDFKLAFTLMALNPFMPLSVRGSIVNPTWLLANPDMGYSLISGSAAERLRRMERESWLQALAERQGVVRHKIETLEIDVDERRLRTLLLATSRRNLESEWARVRSMFPDSEHLAVLSLLEHRILSEEDLIILLSTSLELFLPREEVLARAAQAAEKLSWDRFDPSLVQAFLDLPRVEIYEELDRRLEGFARCNITQLDDFADTYRLEKRLNLSQALILLGVDPTQWKKPPKQQYVERILRFFERKIVASVNRGPLVRLAVGKNSSTIDLSELGTASRSTEQLLDHVLARTGQPVELDPIRLLEQPTLQSRVRRLIQRSRTFRRDTGRHGLFLGYPLIVQRVNRPDQSRSSTRAAPLILWPIRLDTTVAATGAIKLAFEREHEEARLNPALETVLNLDTNQHKNWKQCADDIVKKSSIKYKDVLDVFGQIAKIPYRNLSALVGNEIEIPEGQQIIFPGAILFNCDFAGKSIADDLRHIVQRPVAGTALERLLRMTDASAEQKRNGNSEVDKLGHYCVIDSDPSQLDAVFMSRNEVGLHVEGPPGTGKSQTIVNIIADTVARGEKVLVVCQKQAALSVVEKRLQAEGLGNRLFLVSDATKDREPIIKALREQSEKRRQSTIFQARSERTKVIARIKSLDAQINQQHEAVHVGNNRVGLSYREVLSRLIGLDRPPRKYLDLPDLRSLLAPLDYLQASELGDACADISKLWLDSNFEQNPFDSLKPFGADQGTIQSLTQSFGAYFESECARLATLNQPADFEISEPTPAQNWLERNEHYFSELEEEKLRNLKSWFRQIGPDADGKLKGLKKIAELEELTSNLQSLDGATHSDLLFEPISSINQSELVAMQEHARSALSGGSFAKPTQESIESRWTIGHFLSDSGIPAFIDDGSTWPAAEALARYTAAEGKRTDVLHKYSGCFDVESVDDIQNWLDHNTDYFQALTLSGRQRLAEWLPLLTPQSDKLSQVDGLIDQLKSVQSQLDAIDQAKHNALLYPILLQESSNKLREWSDIAGTACTVASGTVRQEERLNARWKVINFLHQSDLPTLADDDVPSRVKEAFELFVRSETARVEALNQYSTNCFDTDDGSTLEDWHSTNAPQLSSVATSVRECFPHVVPLYDLKAASSNVTTRHLKDLRELLDQIGNLKQSDHSEELFMTLSALRPPDLRNLYALARSATQESRLPNYLNVARAIARWRLAKYLKCIGYPSDDHAIEIFFRAAQLELSLSPLRVAFSDLARRLHVSVKRRQTLLELEEQVKSTIAMLETAWDVIRRLETCPCQDQIREFVQTGDYSILEKFLPGCNGAIARWGARQQSVEKLDFLAEWFESEWLAEQRQLIDGNKPCSSGLHSTRQALDFCNDRTMNAFRLAVELELDLQPLRAQWTQVARETDRFDPNEEFPSIERLPNLVGSLLSELIAAREAAERLFACPCREQALAFARSASGEGFEIFLSQLDGAFARCRARETSLSTLQNLGPWFEASWIEHRRELATSALCDLDSLKRVEAQLPLLNDGLVQTFADAVSLEIKLAPLRKRYKSIRDYVNQSSITTKQAKNAQTEEQALNQETSTPTPGEEKANLRAVEQAVEKLTQQLRDACDATERLYACPAVQILQNMRSSETEGFEGFIAHFKQAIARCLARNASLAALERLSEWFESKWISTQENVITKNQDSYFMLEKLNEALPSIEAFQLFRLRSTELDKKVLQVLATFRAKQADLKKLSESDLQLTVKNTVGRQSSLNWQKELETANPSLTYTGRELQSRIKALADANDELLKINRQLLAEPDYSHGIADDDDWEPVTRLRGQRAKRLREFIQEGAPLGLMLIRPIWLMNPEVASRVLPLKSCLFDKVIFDEASQLPVEYALPVLYRAKTAVVSGDRKQMPPSSFFSNKVESDEDDDSDELNQIDELLTESQRKRLEEDWNRRDIKDCPDLLELAEAVLPSTRLEIHYRSVYRELIDFSNAAFYQGSLNVPCRHPTSEVLRVKPIQVVRVNSVYTDQINKGEAEKVVEILTKIWTRTKRPTVGVVSFNRKQADRISTVISEYADQDPEFATILQEEEAREENGEDMGFFVKNLENVQGDERDVIIFSTTFGRNEDGGFRRNFGKLGQEGGQHRLNVAITRAKRKIILVTSLPIPEISSFLGNNKTPSIPRDFLQAYMDYASKISEGHLDSAKLALSKLNRERSQTLVGDGIVDDFLLDVKEFLESLNYQVVARGHKDHGAFAVDLAIVDPTDGLFKVAIECDAPRHELLQSAFYREVWRRSVLQRSMPIVHRLSVRDWYQDRKQQQTALLGVLKPAMG